MKIMEFPVLTEQMESIFECPEADELIAFARSYLAPVAIREFEDSANLIRFKAKLKAKTLPAIDEWIKMKSDGAPSKAAANP